MVSGSQRNRSTNTALLRTAQAAAPEGVVAVFYDGANDLPHFNPDHDVDPFTRCGPPAGRDSLRRRPLGLDT